MSLSVEDPIFEALLNYLYRTRGFDFSGYKRPSLIRRVDKRIAHLGLAGYESYQDFLEVYPEEFGRLFDTILINVTAFFRDQTAWDILAREILPAILAARPDGEPIRLWSAGCASGEEAYSLAILLAEALGVEQCRDRVKIYATDIDEEALSIARMAIYDAKRLEGVPPALLEKYFVPVDHHRYSFDKDLRRSVIFGRHDLFQDAPISRIDLLTCRNTLMYFHSEAQAKILERFHFALDDLGYLFLGKAETLLSNTTAFNPVDLKRRIFVKVPRPFHRPRIAPFARTPIEGDGEVMDAPIRLRELAFAAAPLAELIVDVNGILVLANARAREMFTLGDADIGRPLQDLQISYRPAELRSSIERAYNDRQPVILREVEFLTAPGKAAFLDIHVIPLAEKVGRPLGASISFFDATPARLLKDELNVANAELGSATEELQSTNEELETTNEELQSTVEELETTNEELQSTNEELETMNEELQSTNEEMETVNEELRQRSAELNRLNVYLESILGSLRSGVVVIDEELRVQLWNARAEDLWGLRPPEVIGKNLLTLDIGLPVHELRPSIRACLEADATFREQDLKATNRRGKPVDCRVTCISMGKDSNPSGVILLLDVEDDARAPAS